MSLEEPKIENENTSGKRERLKKVLRILFRVLAGLVGAVILALVIGVPLPVGRYKGQIEEQLSQSLGQEVSAGKVKAVVSFWPSLRVEEVRVGEGDTDAFSLRADLLKVKIRLLPLLGRKLRIDEIHGRGVEITIDRSSPEERPPPATDMAAKPSGEKKSRWNFDLDEAFFKEVTLRYLGKKREYLLETEAIRLAAPRNRPVTAEATGRLNGAAVSASFEGGTLDDLVDGKSWPVKAEAFLSGLTVKAAGSIADPVRLQGLDLEVEAVSHRLEESLGLFVKNPMQFGESALRGRLREQGGIFGLNDIEASIGQSRLTGNLSLETGSTPPRVTGSLAAQRLDLEPITRKRPKKTTYGYKLDSLKRFDAEVELAVHDVINDPVAIHSVTATAILQEGCLSFDPISAMVAEVPVTVSVEIQGRDGELQMRGSVNAAGVDAGKLLKKLEIGDFLTGTVDSVEFSAGTRGRNSSELARNLLAGFRLAGADLAYGSEADDNRVPLLLNGCTLEMKRPDEAIFRAEGDLLTDPFDLTLRALRRGETWGGPISVTLEGNGAGAALHIEGTALPSGPNPVIDLVMEVRGDEFSDLRQWLGTDKLPEAPYEARARFVADKGGLKLTEVEAVLGETRLEGSAGYRGGITADLSLNRLSLASLADAGGDETPAEIDFDSPILPHTFEIPNADVRVRIGLIDGGPAEIRDLDVALQAVGGEFIRGPFHFTIAGTSLSGDWGVEFKEDGPAARLAVETQQADLGRILSELEIVKDLSLQADGFRFTAEGRGSSLRELWQASSSSLEMDGVRLTLRNPDSSTSTLRIDELRGLTGKGGGISLTGRGNLDETPLALRLQTRGLRETLEQGEFDCRAEVDFGYTRLEIDGDLALPVDLGRMSVGVALSGARMDELEQLFGIPFPAFESYAIGGKLAVDPSGYRLSDLRVKLGESELNGELSIDTTATPAEILVDLHSPKLQLDELWKALPKHDSAESPQESPPRDFSGVLDGLFKVSGKLSIHVDEVLVGKETQGGGNLVADWRGGVLNVEPLRVRLPGGEVLAALTARKDQESISVGLNIDAEGVEYGPIAKMVDPKADMEGKLWLDVDIDSSALSMDQLLAHANGTFDFTVVPENMGTEFLDLWAVSLLNVLVPRLDEGSRSKLNCIVGLFNIEDGVMTPHKTLLDTTRIQARAKGSIDLKNRRIRLELQPRPKKLEVFRLEAPLVISGSFESPRIYPKASGFAITALRWWYTPIAVFLDLFKKEIPAECPSCCTEAAGRE